MPVNGHNASHYFYVHPINKPKWKNDLHERDIHELLGFDPFSDDKQKKQNKKKINGKTYFQHLSLPFKDHFRLTTIYPGLLIGTGYSHYAISEGENSDYQLGFFFDHTLGIPIIPGSTVKGVLKNVFPKSRTEKWKEKLNYINDLVKKELEATDEVISESNWEEIFFENGNVFFHAFPIAINENNVGDEKKILTDDAITPHHPGDPDALFKEPIPLKFIKIPAGVTFKFQFRITDYNKDGIKLSSGNILNVFKQILLDFGICAKRNIGYGHFIT